jgi:hypothetical protein
VEPAVVQTNGKHIIEIDGVADEGVRNLKRPRPDDTDLPSDPKKAKTAPSDGVVIVEDDSGAIILD